MLRKRTKSPRRQKDNEWSPRASTHSSGPSIHFEDEDRESDDEFMITLDEDLDYDPHRFSVNDNKFQVSKPKKKRKSKKSRRSSRKLSRASNASSTTSVKRKSMAPIDAENAVLEFGEHDFYTGFNLEQWWRKTAMPTRLNALMLGILLTIALSHLLVGMHFISKSLRQTIRSPYVCEEEECQKASQWLTKTMDTSVSPCKNFYEFMCGNYPKESEKEGDLMQELITIPAFKIEFGANSLLAKVLKMFHNDSSYDQTIRYYQACLNEKKRHEFGLEAFFDTLKIVLGTDDLSKFESMSLSMEEIGANLLRHAGEAVYINMAFYTYPYIVILRPTYKIRGAYPLVDNGDPSEGTETLLEILLEKLLPQLGVTDQKQKDDAYYGIVAIARIELLIRKFVSPEQIPKELENPPQEFVNLVISTLDGLCPPFGVHLDMHKMLSLFIQEEFRLEFYDLMALKHYLALKICFEEDPSKFTYFQIDNPRTAFVAPWIFGLFWDFLLSMDTRNLMKDWHIALEYLPNARLVQNLTQAVEDHVELRCSLELSKNLGYLPALRYLLSTQTNPVEDLHSKSEEIRKLYFETRNWFREIPESEMEPSLSSLAEIIFERAIHVDVLMPLVSGFLDISAASDRLDFGEDHLENSLIARHYTIEKARQNWIGSTNAEPTLKWWGFGDPFDIEEQLFDIRSPYVKTLEFEEKNQTIRNKQYQKFLGRPQLNHVFFLLTMFDEPYVNQTLFLKFGGLTIKMIRTIYSILSDALYSERYPSIPFLQNRIHYDNPNLLRPRKCSILYHGQHEHPNDEHIFNFIFDHNVTSGYYMWYHQVSSLSMLSLKQTVHMLETTRRKLSKERLTWQVPRERRKQRMSRLLPGKMLSTYTEKQLLFMTYVRNACRGSWKDHNDELKHKRFDLEATILTVLMQMEEFQKEWKCKKKDFMSNEGNDRCFQWVPTDYH